MKKSVLGRPGAAAVEFAVLLPFLAFLFIIAIDWARVFYYSVTCLNCARNGALWASDPVAQQNSPDTNIQDVVQSKNPTHISGGAKSIVTLQPGVYQGGIVVTGQATLDMAPGIYYMDGGSFSFTGQGNLNANGVMIVNAPQSNSDVININGLGSINLSPPTSGIYAGISLWQQRSASQTLTISGNGARPCQARSMQPGVP
jgi:hypothetical protein